VGKPWTFYGSRRVLIRSASKVELLATSELSSQNPSGLQGQDSSPNPSGLQGQDSSPNPSPTLPQPPGTIEIASICGSKALVVHAGGELLKVDRLQPEGKAEIDGLAWANGVNLQSIPCFTFT
jgi:methionyl-tRNA formyltransferase